MSNQDSQDELREWLTQLAWHEYDSMDEVNAVVDQALSMHQKAVTEARIDELNKLMHGDQRRADSFDGSIYVVKNQWIHDRIATLTNQDRSTE
jgi:hypothetical protein